MLEKEVFVLGIGHNTPVFIDLILSCGYSVSGMFHYNNDRTGEVDHGYAIIGSFDDLWKRENLSGMNFVLTMGDVAIRENLAKKILSKGGSLPSLIHPLSVISRFAKVSPIATAVFPFTFVQSDSIVGEGTVLLSHVNISHNTKIGDYCFVAGGAHIGAYTELKKSVFVGQGAVLISAKVKCVGEKAFIGAMSLVTKDVEPGVTVKGIPAKSL